MAIEGVRRPAVRAVGARARDVAPSVLGAPSVPYRDALAASSAAGRRAYQVAMRAPGGSLLRAYSVAHAAGRVWEADRLAGLYHRARRLPADPMLDVSADAWSAVACAGNRVDALRVLRVLESKVARAERERDRVALDAVAERVYGRSYVLVASARRRTDAQWAAQAARVDAVMSGRVR